jgi:hypothetical protein
MVAKRHVATAIALAVAAFAVDLAFGHHGWSGYDSGQVLDLTGVIQEAGYEHPHAYVKMQVRDRLWLVVLAPPSRMERRGVPRGALAVGTPVTVVGYPHRGDDGEMRAERITLNGKTAELR